MIRPAIKIGSGSMVDIYSTYGLIYLSSTDILGAPYKEYEKTNYAEEEGEHILAKNVADAFDYEMKFLIEGATATRVNGKIATFNAALQSNGTFKKVELYNFYKKTKIVGYPMPLSQPTEYWRDKAGNDAAIVSLKVRVAKPSECNFNDSTTPPQV